MNKLLKVALSAVMIIFLVSPCLLIGLKTVGASLNDDWPMFRHDPAHAAYSNISGPSTPKVLWTFSAKGNSMESSPAIVDGKLYVGAINGNIYCLNATDGNQIWVNFKIDSEIQSSPAVVNGFLYICDTNGVVYSLDAQTGTITWKHQTGLGMSSSPSVVNGYVYISSSDGNLYCLRAIDGIEVWRFSVTSLAGPSSPYDEPTITSGRTSPAVVDGYVYIGGTHFYCLNATSGAISWSFSANVACAPTVYEGKVYFSSRDKNAYCFDALSGKKIWEKPIITSILYTGTSAAVANGLVYFGSWVQCVNASNGERIWRYGTGDIYTSSGPTVAGQYAYFCGNDGNTYCVNASSGEYIWKSEGSFGGSPAVVNGVLYIAGNSIIAFADSETTPTTSPIPTLSENSTPASSPTPSATSTPYPSPSPLADMAVSNPVLAVVGGASAAILIIIFLAYITNSKENIAHAHFRRRLSPSIALALILIISLSSVIVLYANNFSSSNGSSTSSPQPSTSNESPIYSPEPTTSTPQPTTSNEVPSPSPQPLEATQPLWQTNIEHFVTNMAFSDEKLFITTMQDTYAYGIQDGQLIWKNDYPSREAQVYNGSVFIGTIGSRVYRLDENTGEKTREYQAPVSSSIAWKSTPSFLLIADGKVIVSSSDGRGVYDVDSGGLYWEISGFPYPWTGPPKPTLGELGNSSTQSNYVFIYQGDRVDINTGKRLWETGNWGATIIIDQNKVIFWNYYSSSEQPNTILCLDPSTGRKLWSFNPGVSIYQATVVGSELLLFGATDGNLFALNLADGTLIWKTLVDSQGMMDGNNLPADAKSFSDPAISPIVVDNQTGTVTWGFLITQRQIGGIIGENLYTGVFCSIDLSNGNILKTSKVQTNCTTDNTGIGLAPGKSILYLTAGLDLWIIDKATWIPTLIEHYEHYTLPVLNNNIVYLAADLNLSAYK